MLAGRGEPWVMGSQYGFAAVVAMGTLAMRRQTFAYDGHRNEGLTQDGVEEEHDEVREAAQRQAACRDLVAGIGMAHAVGEEPEDWKRNGFEGARKALQPVA